MSLRTCSEVSERVRLSLRAGVAKFAALGTITEELNDWTFDINVKGMLFTVQKALPLLTDLYHFEFVHRHEAHEAQVSVDMYIT